MRRRFGEGGQLTIMTVAILTLLLVSMLGVVMVYQREVYRAGGAEVKSIVVTEVLESVKSDLKRILALVMGNASRTYAFHPYMHNLTVFREAAMRNLYKWMALMGCEYGTVVDVKLAAANITLGGVEYPIPEGYMFKLYWYKPVAVTIGYVEARVSIPGTGIYNKTLDAYVGLYLKVVEVENVGSYTRVVVRALLDEGYPLTDIRRVELKVLYPDLSYYWREASIVNYSYLGRGLWELYIEPRVQPMGRTPSSPEGVIPLRIYVVDWRGIVVSALTYSSIALRVEKNTPEEVVYFDGSRYVTLYRTSTPDEVYTVELDWRFSLHFLLNEVPLSGDTPPPIPPIPVKQLRVYTSVGGSHWRLAPFQTELWELRDWHGLEVWWPVAPADPAYWFNESCRLVFQVRYPRVEDYVRYVNITWESDCDADLVEWNTSLTFEYEPPDYKDVVSETFRLELIDEEHSVMRDYGYNYYGVAALGFRDPDGSAYGPTNIHAFGKWGSRLGAWRPHGTWRVFYRYGGPYSWARLPVRIFVTLDSDRVGNVYTGAVRSDYYDTLAIVYVINGSRYMACLVHVYWKYTKTDYGFWMFASMGGGRPSKYMYLKEREWWWGWRYNVSEEYSYAGWWWSHREYEYPNFFCTHWGSGIGRAVFLSRSAVSALYDVGGNPRFAVTKRAPDGRPQHSLEYEFKSLNNRVRVYSGTHYSYWFVVYMYGASDSWGEWRKAYT
ncbi:MAG: hypothetical protein DRN06_04230, partial [Thermoprotei archaeon]